MTMKQAKPHGRRPKPIQDQPPESILPADGQLDRMANDYSRRARLARVRQGRPPVIRDTGALTRLANIMAAGEAERQAAATTRSGSSAA